MRDVEGADSRHVATTGRIGLMSTQESQISQEHGIAKTNKKYKKARLVFLWLKATIKLSDLLKRTPPGLRPLMSWIPTEVITNPLGPFIGVLIFPFVPEYSALIEQMCRHSYNPLSNLAIHISQDPSPRADLPFLLFFLSEAPQGTTNGT